MNASEMIRPNEGGVVAGITSQMAVKRARTVVLRNSRIVCWLTMGMGVSCLSMGICMMLIVVSLVFPLSAFTFMRGLAAVQWGLGGLAVCFMCPALWKWGLRMLDYKVTLDERGVGFNLGTKKLPQDVFMAWEQVASIEQKRVDNAQQLRILGTDGGMAQFSSYTFFRPKHVARLVAERAGLTIRKG